MAGQVEDRAGAVGRVARDRVRPVETGRDVEHALAGATLDPLKAANVALDAGTQDLATLLIEQAMDEALERRGLV